MGLFALLPKSAAARLNRTPVVRRLARGAFWTLAGTLATRALTIPVSIILARSMGPSHYGELGIINSSVDLFTVFAGFGLGLTANKYIAEYRTKDPVRAGRIMVLSRATAVVTGLLCAIVLFFLAPWLASHTLAAPHLTSSLRIGCLILFFAALNGAQSGALYGFEAFKTTAQVQTLIGVLNVPLVIAGYFLAGLNGVLWSMVLTGIIGWAFRAYVLQVETRRAGVPIQYTHCMQELPILWQFSVPALLAGSMVAPVNWVCSTILVNRPNGYAEMGIYNAASQWYGALLFLPVALGSALLPLLSERLGDRDVKSSSKLLSVMLRLNAVIAFPGAVALSLASPYIMRMYGSAYSHAASTLVVVVFTAAALAVLMPVGDVISASGRMWTGLAMNTGWAVVAVTCTGLLAHWGSLGLATARLLAYIVHATWTFAFAYKIIRAAPTKSPSYAKDLAAAACDSAN